MTIQRSHGALRPAVSPADELPAPAPSQAEPVHRRNDGTLIGSASAKALGARGGRAKSQRARLVSALGLKELAADEAFAPYRDAGDDFVRAHLATLATSGDIGPGPSSIVASAGLQLAASRFLSDRASLTGDADTFKLASQLANDSRQNLLAAYELATREAKARPRRQSDLTARLLEPHLAKKSGAT